MQVFNITFYSNPFGHTYRLLSNYPLIPRALLPSYREYLLVRALWSSAARPVRQCKVITAATSRSWKWETVEILA